MSKANYEEALRRMLAHEGGYTNHPDDPGGPTNYGVTLAVYRKYINANATAADIKAMPIAHAKAIYRAQYWDSQRCDELPPGVDYAMFDYGVNSGIGRSGKVLRRILKMSDATSVVTADVVALAKTKNATALADAINNERLAFLKSLKTWPVFGGGWGRRCADMKTVCRAMSCNAITPETIPSVIPSAKGEVAKPPTKTVVASGTAPLAASGGLFPAWIAAHPTASVAIAVGIVAAIGLVVYLLNKRRNAKQEAPVPGWQAPALAAA